MNQKIYNTPESDVSLQHESLQKVERSNTKVFGWILLVLAVLGLFVAIFGLFMTFQVDAAATGHSKSTLVMDAVLSTVSKFGLLAVGIGMLMRASWIAGAITGGFIVSLLDTIFKGVKVIPMTAASTADSATEMGIYVGFYSVAAISLAIYIGLFIYVRTKKSKLEFRIKAS